MKTRNVDAYRELHQIRTYGNTAVRMRRFIEPWVQIDAPKTLLDYGAGQGGFANELNAPSLEVRDSYDPAIPAISTLKRERYDYAICIDVMEHLEPDEVPAVLADVARLTDRALFIIGTHPARAILPDGRNAHTTVEKGPWWGERIREAFGTAVAIPVFRKKRCAFKTYKSGAGEWARYGAKLGRAEVGYQLWRLKGGRYD